MRKGLALLLFGLVLLGTAATDAFAQAAPTPQVTITGFIDTITSASRNLQGQDFVNNNDTEWYTRNRIRVDMIGALGSAKAVVGIEIDSTWGQVSGTDTFVTNQAGSPPNNAQRAGTTSGFDVNTDTVGSIEVKWAYVEFPIPGLPTVVRLGAQPFAVNYKLASYASGDFAGANVVTTFTPGLKWHLTYAQVEERLIGACQSTFGCNGGSPGIAAPGFNRGDDWAAITSVEWTPMKGLDLRPMYAFFNATGATNGNARRPLSASSNLSADNTANPRLEALGYPANGQEYRSTVGLDARWRFGAFSLDPTVLYQWGSVDTCVPLTARPGNTAACNLNNPGTTSSADMSAWYVDITAGWRIGPVLLEARGLYTTGNKADDKLWKEVNFYQPLNTDTSYWAGGWGNIYSLGIDYFNGAIRGMGSHIGLDRYGRAQIALRANYAWTPGLDTYVLVSPGWTAQKVDTDGIVANTYGSFASSAPHCVNINGNCKGDSNYIGTEANLGLTWRFAPGLAFDAVFAYMWTGDALGGRSVLSLSPAVITQSQSPENIYTGVARVRYSW